MADRTLHCAAAAVTPGDLTRELARSVLTSTEAAYCLSRRHWQQRVAGRIAAKVAVSRVLGRSRCTGVPPGAIEVVAGSARFGMPGLSGEPRQPTCCAAADESWGPAIRATSVSIGHQAGLAVALASTMAPVGVGDATADPGPAASAGSSAVDVLVSIVVAPVAGVFLPEPVLRGGAVRRICCGDVIGIMATQCESVPVVSPFTGDFGGFWPALGATAPRSSALVWLRPPRAGFVQDERT